MFEPLSNSTRKNPVRSITVTTSRLAALSGICLAIAGCAELTALTQPSSGTAQAADPNASSQVVQASPDMTATLTELQVLRDEVKTLRNTVERQAFEIDKLKNRQLDLYNDLDRRLRELERGQAASATQPATNTVGQVYSGTTSVNSQQPTYANVGGGVNTGVGTGNTGITTIGTPVATAPTNQGVGGLNQGVGQTVGQAGSQLGGQVGTQPGLQTGIQTGSQVPSIGTQPTTVTVAPATQPTPGTGTQTGQVAIVQPSIGAGGTATGGVVTVSAQDAYDQAFGLLKQSRYADAVVAFEAFVRNYPANDLTDDAYYWMAEAHYVTRNFEPALNGFRTVTASFPGSQRVPASYLKIGYIQYEIGAYADARETLGFIMKTFPTHRIAVSAETRLKKMDREGR